MADYLSISSPLIKMLLAFSMFTLRYLLFAGGAYLVFYVFKNKHCITRKIQNSFPSKKDISSEVRYSIASFVVFSGIITLLSYCYAEGYTKVYANIDDHSIGYLIFTIIASIFIHDTYFYWTHRLMHLPYIYKYVHAVHHRSRNPTPWASFAFHPVEAVIEIGTLPLLLFIFPIHPIALLAFSLFMTAMNVMGHLGFEIFPKNFVRHSIGKWMNSSTHHNMHHHYNKCNYGLYFNLWDRLIGTNHKKYEQVFDEVISKREEAKRALKPVAV